MVSKFSTNSVQIKKILNQRWEMLQCEPYFQGLFNKKKTLFAYNRSRNLKELINKETPQCFSSSRYKQMLQLCTL